MTVVQRDTNPATYLEEGSYEFCVGSDVRSAAFAGAYEQPFKVVETLTEAMAWSKRLSVMKAVAGEDGTLKPGYEASPAAHRRSGKTHEREPYGADSVHRRQRL